MGDRLHRSLLRLCTWVPRVPLIGHRLTICLAPPVVHCFQAYRSKYWIVYPTLVLGALTEILGWSARYWSSRNVLLITPFIMQISTSVPHPHAEPAH